MTVTYLPPVGLVHASVGASLEVETVTSGPAYCRTRSSTRWHLIRSAIDRLTAHGEIRRTVQDWCGAFAGRDPLMVDEIPDGEPTCGTCYGRREGHDPERPDLLFTPRLLQRPKVCPGSRSTFYAKTDVYNRATCLVCGDIVKMRGYGGWYGGKWGPQFHAPGPGLIEGCEYHGWKELVECLDAQDRRVIACKCKTVARHA